MNFINPSNDVRGRILMDSNCIKVNHPFYFGKEDEIHNLLSIVQDEKGVDGISKLYIDYLIQNSSSYPLQNYLKVVIDKNLIVREVFNIIFLVV